MSRLQRETTFAGIALFSLLSVLFFPFLWGHASLLSSSRQQPSIYPQGAAGNSPVFSERMLLDDNGSDATVEPAAALEHHIIFDEHQLPLWNRNDAFGMPLAAAMQEGTFCPFDFINEIDPSPDTYSWYVVSRLFAAGFFAFLFLRRYVRAIAAFAGAVAFMLTGYFILFASMPHLSIECLIPAAFYFADRLLRTPNFLTSATFAILIALLFIGGFPEATLLAFCFVTAFAALRLITKTEIGPVSRAVGAYVLATALGIGSAAILLIPFAEFVRVSFTTHVLGANVPPPGIFQIDPRPGVVFGAYLVPLSLGPVWHGLLTGRTDYNSIRGYWGVVPFFFALLAVAQAMLRRLSRESTVVVAFFAAIAILLIAKRFGNPIVNWIGYLPGLSAVIFNKYEEPLIGFCIAALFGFGFEALLARKVGIRTWACAIVATLVTLNVGYVNLAQAVGALASSPYLQKSYAFALDIFVCVVGSTFLLRRDRNAGRWQFFAERAPVAIVALVTIELTFNYFVPMWYLKNVQPNKFTNAYAGAPYVSYLQDHLAPGERIFAEQEFLLPNWQAAFNLADIRSNEAIYPARYLPLIRGFVPPNNCDANIAFVGCQPELPDDPAMAKLFALSGVRYIVSPRELFDARFKTIYQSDAIIYRFGGESARARVYHDVRVESGPQRVLSDLTSASNDVNAVAYVDQSDLGVRPTSSIASISKRGSKADPVTFVRDISNDVLLHTRSASAGLLVLSDTYYPGWNAYVDGKPSAVLRANYLFRGVFVGAGAHDVEFRYEPVSYRIGEIISAICAIALVLCFGMHMKSRSATPDALA